MRRKINITLSDTAIVPLRYGCYGRMELDAQKLTQALEAGVPQHSRHALAAYTRLTNTGDLLHRIGWTHDDHRDQVTLDKEKDLDTAIAALREEAAAESAARTAALEDNAPQAAQRATARELVIHEVLSELEAACKAEGAEHAAGLAAEPASE
jgi:hypothetical protein